MSVFQDAEDQITKKTIVLAVVSYGRKTFRHTWGQKVRKVLHENYYAEGLMLRINNIYDKYKNKVVVYGKESFKLKTVLHAHNIGLII
jgi:hypothetical protein